MTSAESTLTMQTERTTKRRCPTLIIYALILAAYWIGAEIPKHLMVAMTNSVGHRLFLYTHDQKPADIKKGDYVVFPLTTDIHEGCNPCRVVKKAACLSGEYLRLDQNDYYFCGEEYLGVAKHETSDGRPVFPFVYNGTIPKGKFFAFGGAANSYDSRYYGFIEEEKVEGIAKPIL